MKLLKSTFIAVCLVALFIGFYSCKSSSTGSAFYDGSWTGSLDGQKIQLTCDSKNNVYMILYTATGCTGRWEPEQKKSKRVVFNEKIEIGTSKCSALNTKVVVTKVNADELKISYFGHDNSASNAGYLRRD